MSAPVWILAMDGVVNAYQHVEGQRKHAWPHYLHLDAQQYELPQDAKIAVGLLVVLREHLRHGLDLRWGSADGEVWNRHLADLGQVTLPVLSGSAIDLVRQLAEQGHPIVWTDPHLTHAEKAMLGEYGVPHLCIAPDPHHGLTPEHCLRIARFLHEHPAT